MDFEQRYDKLVKNAGYYKTHLHMNKCKICQLPDGKIKEKINQMILDNCSISTISLFLKDQYPDIFQTDPKYTIEKHRKFLPFLLSDVKIKSIFKRARNILNNVDLYELSSVEKAKLITEIEAKLVEEFGEIEDERISLIKALFSETLPLMVARLNESIVDGYGKEIKYLADASSAVVKMSTALSSFHTGIGIEDEEKNDKENSINFDELDEDNPGEIKNNVISLADSINKAVGDD